LARVDAILARNLLGATPTVQPSPRAAIARLIWAAIAIGSPKSLMEPETSMNASSRDSGSTRGENERKTSRMRSE
jgi:hypothetical protein